MGAYGLIGVLCVGAVLVPALAVAAWRPDLPWDLARRAGLARATAVLDAAAGAVAAAAGRVPAALVAYVFTVGAVMLVCWPLGVLARGSLALDEAVFRWSAAHRTPALTDLMDVVTQMGNRSITKPATLLAVVVLFLLRRRRRWVVPAVFLTFFVTQFYFQGILEHAVGRPDPPGAGGNYPSGGCARVILTYGLVVWFCLRERRAVSRPAAVALYGLVVAAGVLEAYSRTYLLKHWVTDTVGGLVYGGVLLLGAVAVATLLDRPGPLAGHAPEGSRGRERPRAGVA